METIISSAKTVSKIFVGGRIVGEVTKHSDKEFLAAICFGDMVQAGLSFAEWGKTEEEAIKKAVAVGRKRLRVLVKSLNWLKAREPELFDDTE